MNATVIDNLGETALIASFSWGAWWYQITTDASATFSQNIGTVTTTYLSPENLPNLVAATTRGVIFSYATTTLNGTDGNATTQRTIATDSSLVTEATQFVAFVTGSEYYDTCYSESITNSTAGAATGASLYCGSHAVFSFPAATFGQLNDSAVGLISNGFALPSYIETFGIGYLTVTEDATLHQVNYPIEWVNSYVSDWDDYSGRYWGVTPNGWIEGGNTFSQTISTIVSSTYATSDYPAINGNHRGYFSRDLMPDRSYGLRGVEVFTTQIASPTATTLTKTFSSTTVDPSPWISGLYDWNDNGFYPISGNDTYVSWREVGNPAVMAALGMQGFSSDVSADNGMGRQGWGGQVLFGFGPAILVPLPDYPSGTYAIVTDGPVPDMIRGGWWFEWYTGVHLTAFFTIGDISFQTAFEGEGISLSNQMLDSAGNAIPEATISCASYAVATPFLAPCFSHSTTRATTTAWLLQDAISQTLAAYFQFPITQWNNRTVAFYTASEAQSVGEFFPGPNAPQGYASLPYVFPGPVMSFTNDAVTIDGACLSWNETATTSTVTVDTGGSTHSATTSTWTEVSGSMQGVVSISANTASVMTTAIEGIFMKGDVLTHSNLLALTNYDSSGGSTSTVLTDGYPAWLSYSITAESASVNNCNWWKNTSPFVAFA